MINSRDEDGHCPICGLGLSEEELDDLATHECPEGFAQSRRDHDLQRRLASLPKWAQEHINELKTEIRRREALKQTHALLADKDRDWFTIRNDGSVGGLDEKGFFRLWILQNDDPRPICSLGQGDLLFVARAKKVPHGQDQT